MSLFVELLLSPQISIVQIIIVAYVGAILGEARKEIDDDIPIELGRFVISWFGSGFSGAMVGMILQGTVAKNNVYLVLGGSGAAGFMGHKKSVALLERMLSSFSKAADEEKDEGKKDKKKKEDKDD